MAGVHFKVTGDANGYIAATRQAEAATKGMVNNVTDEVKRIDNIFKTLATGAGALFTVQMASKFSKQVAQVRGEFQQLEVAFETMLQSREKADALMKDVVDLAATTPFDLKEVASGTKQLLAYGIASEDVNDTLVRLGDIAAGLSLPLGDLVYLYGTTAAQGRMFTQDLRQFQGRGVPMVDALADVMGVAKNQVAGLVTEGKVGFPEMQKAIESLTDKGSRFGGLMEKQSKTITGQIRNLQDSIEQMFNEIGRASEGAISSAVGGVAALVANYEKVGKAVGQIVVTYGAYKAVVATASAINVAAAKAERAILTDLLTVKGSEVAATEAETASRGKAAAAIMSEVSALKLELNERVKNLTTAMLAAQGEEAAARTKVELLSVQVGLAKMRSAQVKEELALAMESGDAAAIEAAKTKLATAAKNQNTVSRELGVATRNLEIATSNAEAATSARNTFVNNIETASVERQTTATLLLAEAKKKLASISKGIVSTLSNPYVLAGAAVAALAFSVWGLIDSLKVEERAHENVREELEKMNKAFDDNKSKAEELIRVIQDESSTEMMRAKALNELRALYPGLYKDMSDQEIITLKQAEATKQLAEETERLREEELRRILQEKKEALARQEGTNTVTGANAGATYQVNTGNSLQAKRLRAEIKDLEEQVNELNKLREQAEFNAMPKEAKIISLNQQIEDLKAQNLELDTQIAETMAKKWTIEDLGSLDFDWNSSATADDLLAKQQENVRMIEELMKKRNQIESSDKSSDPTDKELQAAHKRKQAKEKAEKELIKMQRDLNYKVSQADIDSMNDGYAKSLKQLEFNLEKEKNAIEDQKEELLKKRYDEKLQNWLSEDQERKAYNFKFTATLTPAEIKVFEEMGRLAQEQFNKGRADLEKEWTNKGELTIRQFEVDAMSDGASKEAAQRQLDNEKELHNLELQRDAYIEAAKAAHILAEQKKIAADPTYMMQMFDESQANADFDKIVADTTDRQKTYKADSEQEDMWEYLKEYGSFQQKKQAITEQYNKKIANASSEGMKLSLRAEMDATLKGLEQSYNSAYQNIFKNPTKMTAATIKGAISLAQSEIKKIQGKGVLNEDDLGNIERLQQAIDSLQEYSDSSFWSNFGAGMDGVIAKTNQLLSLRKRIQLAQESGDKKALAAAKEEQAAVTENLKQNLIGTGVDHFVSGLSNAATAMKEIAELSGDVELEKLADSLENFSEFVGSVASGAASGGWVGAIIGGVTSVFNVITESLVNTQAQLIKAKNDALDFSNALRVAALEINKDEFKSIFGTNELLLAIDAAKKYQEAIQAYNDKTDYFKSWGGKLDSYIDYLRFAEALKQYQKENGYILDEFTYEAAPGTEVGFDIQAEAFTHRDEIERGLDMLQGMKIKTFDANGWQEFWGKSDRYTSLIDLAPELWGSDGVFDTEKAQIFLDTNTQLTKEQRKQIQNYIDLANSANEAKKVMEEWVNSFVGDTATSLADAIFDAIDNGSNAWDNFEKKGADVIRSLGKQMLVSMIQSDLTSMWSERLMAATGDPEQLAIEYEAMMEWLKGKSEEYAQVAQNWENIHGYEADSTREASEKGVAQASQSSVYELNGRMTAVQSHTFSINERVGSLLNVANQMLARVISIEGHTARLKAIETALIYMRSDISDMLTKGIRIKA